MSGETEKNASQQSSSDNPDAWLNDQAPAVPQADPPDPSPDAAGVTLDPPVPYIYLVTKKDTPDSVTAHMGRSNYYEEVYKPNMDTIEAAARAGGFPAGSNGGSILVAGTVLK